jgi:hypothetical protein
MVQLKAFFEQYAQALNAASVEQISAAFAAQFIASGPGYSKCVTNDVQFRAVITQADQFYRQNGMASLQIGAYKDSPLDGSFVLVQVEWRVFGSDGGELFTFEASYVVQEIDGTPKVILSISHNEQQRMREMGLAAN